MAAICSRLFILSQAREITFTFTLPINEMDDFTTIAVREKSSLMTAATSSTRVSPLYRIPPFYYIHVLDQNTSLARLEIGPKTFFRQDNETITVGPEKMITLPPRHYCIVENPAVIDEAGRVKLSHANIEIRLETNHKEPFPLYPGEVLRQVHPRENLVRFFIFGMVLAGDTVEVCSSEFSVETESRSGLRRSRRTTQSRRRMALRRFRYLRILMLFSEECSSGLHQFRHLHSAKGSRDRRADRRNGHRS